MSEVKISALPPASSANPSDVVAIVQDGVTKKLPIGAITGNAVDNSVSGLKLLPVTPISGIAYNVIGFYSGATVGGGLFVFNPGGNKASHNGVTHYAPEAIAAWNGTQADIATLLNWTGAGSGVWVRILSGFVTPEMAGAVLDNATDSTAAVQRAVNAALALSCELYWAGGTALVTGSIANFHDVVHAGKGAIRRGSDTFYITLSPSQTNTLYVSTSGSDTNDGLTAALPLRNGQRAVDVISARSTLAIPGFWVVRFASGTYSRIRYPGGGIITQNPVAFIGADVGGHPNVPTTIISEGASVSAVGLRGWASDVIVSSIKFTGWCGTVSSAGVSFGNNANVYLINAHFENCYYGASVAEHGQIDVKGGRFDACGFLPSSAGGGAGIRGLFHVKFSAGTQNAGTLAGAPIFRGCYQALFAQEHCNGHADFLDIADCERGISLNVNTRLNMDGTSLLRCSTYGVRALGCSVPFISANTVFGTGADKCGINLITQDGSAANPSILTGFGNSSDDRYVSKTTADVSAGTSSTAIVESTFKAGFFADSNNTLNMSKSINIVVYGECSGTAAGKRVQVRLGAETPVSLTLPSTATGFFKAEFDVVFVGGASPAQRVYGLATSQNSVSHSVIADRAANFNADTLIKVEALKLNAADTVTIKGSLIKVSGI